MQFTLTCRDEDGTLTQKRFDGTYLDDVVTKFQDFLHGVGFVFEELEVQVYPATVDEVDEDEIEEDASPIFLSEDDAQRIASYYSQYRATD